MRPEIRLTFRMIFKSGGAPDSFGPVGAAKALHLLAAEFFPLWDRAITKGYGIYLGSAGQNAVEYLGFMTTVISQIGHVCPAGNPEGLLKRIDEFNYCRFTKGWL